MTQDGLIREAARSAAREISKHPVRDHDLLVSSGLIDSLAILRLIGLLESKLGISIPTDQVQPDDFDSVDLIVETVERVTQ